MKRVLVIGCCGSGKSTFSKKLQSKLNIELIHLDQHYWQEHWVEPSKDEWVNKVEQLVERDEWIMDGNYGGTMSLRMEKADTILFLDYSTSKCLWRVVKRTIQHYDTERPDMPKGCKERFDLDFIRYVTRFNTVQRKSILERLNHFKNDKRIEVFKRDKDAEGFLKTLAIT